MKVRSMRGVELDMSRFAAQNETTVAVGNAGLNARGDILGRGGKVVKSREQVAHDYHQSNPRAVKNVAIKNLQDEVVVAEQPAARPPEAVEFVNPADAVAAIEQQMKPASKRKITTTDE